MEFRFLTLEDVLELHEMQLESYGGAIRCHGWFSAESFGQSGAAYIPLSKTIKVGH